MHCPRCSSTNTKFCYYNNYSLSQPRYFCKTCRRYWTEGGSLRNVPVGGGSRKNRRSSSTLNSSKKPIILDNLTTPPPNYIPQDPSLAYNNTPHQFNNRMSEFAALPLSFSPLDVNNLNGPQNPVSSCAADTSHHIPAMELLKTGNIGSRGLSTSSSSFLSLPVHNSSYSSLGFPLHGQIKPSLSFSLDGFVQNEYGNIQGVEDHDARNGLLPFEESKPASTNERDRDRSNGFTWNGMLARGSW